MFKNLFLAWLLLWGLFGQVQTPLNSPNSASPSGGGQETILVMGDSLSAAHGIAPEQGWVNLLDQRLRKKGYHHAVINGSISGETTSGGRRRLSQTLPQVKPTLVILELGANDGLRGLSLKEMQKNLATMIDQSQQAGAKVLLLGMRIPPNYGKAYTERFQQIYLDLATQYQIPVVPFFLESVAQQRDLMQEDNLHPTAPAQEKLLETVWETVEEILK
jgi:acyl-CoA thioesterase I